MRDHLSDDGGIVEDARLLTLSQHFIEVGLIDVEPVALQRSCAECRSLSLLAYGRQLRPVADEQHAAVLPLIDIAYEVVEQASRSEVVVDGRIGDHRCLVDDEQGVAVQIVIEIECREVASRPLSVDVTMDGVCRVAGIEREHLRSPSRGSQQYQFLLQRQQGAHDGSGQCGLAGASRSAQDHHGLW